MASHGEDIIKFEFGRRARSARHRIGLSQSALGERAGLDRTYIGGVERGERNLSLVNIVKVAAAVGLDPADLVRGLQPP